MPRAKRLPRATAAQLVIAHLGLENAGEPFLRSRAPGRQPPADHAGPVLQMRGQRADRPGDWSVLVWLTASSHLAGARPDHQLAVHPDHRVTTSTAGRPPSVPEGLDRRPRVTATLHDDDHAAVQRLMAAHGLSESAVVRALVAQALRGEAPPWQG